MSRRSRLAPDRRCLIPQRHRLRRKHETSLAPTAVLLSPTRPRRRSCYHRDETPPHAPAPELSTGGAECAAARPLRRGRHRQTTRPRWRLSAVSPPHPRINGDNSALMRLKLFPCGTQPGPPLTVMRKIPVFVLFCLDNDRCMDHYPWRLRPKTKIYDQGR